MTSITFRHAIRCILIPVSIVLVPPLMGWATSAFGQEKDPYKAFYSSFASSQCCWTNRCCVEIEAHDVEDLGHGVFRIKATGQVVPRTGFSPGGFRKESGYHRCACDPKPGGGWTPFWPGAHTRCLFTPLAGS